MTFLCNVLVVDGFDIYSSKPICSCSVRKMLYILVVTQYRHYKLVMIHASQIISCTEQCDSCLLQDCNKTIEYHMHTT